MGSRAKIIPKFQSIQVTMAFAYSVLMVCTILVVFSLSFRVTEDALRLNSRQYAAQLVGQVAYTISTYIDAMKSISTFLLSNQDILDFYTREDIPRDEKDILRSKIESTLSTVSRNRPDVSLISILGTQGEVIFHDPLLEQNSFVVPAEQRWYRTAREAAGRPVFSPSHVQNLVKDRHIWVVSLSRLVVDPITQNGIAVLLIDLNYHLIENLCTNVSLGKRGYVFIVDTAGNLIYHPRQQVIFSNLDDEYIQEVLETAEDHLLISDEDGDKLYNIAAIENAGWKVVGVSYLDELGVDRAFLARIYTVWGLGFLAITLLFSILLSLQISRPIKRLRDTIKAVEQGNFDIQATIQSPNEIGELGRDFNIMVQKIKELIELNILEQQNKRKSELKALQAQINPHFLYNTLDSVIWMAEDKQEQNVIAMVAALAKLFRLSISRGNEIISIGEEVEHVRQYLIIQKMRYLDKLDYEIDVDPELFPYQTVKIILQPLVENAIYHGIKNNAIPGKVHVCGCRADQGVELRVRDNGVGMRTEVLASIMKPHDRDSKHGLGARNVDERIKLHFGAQYGLEYFSSEGGGTEVLIRLPLLPKDGHL